MFRTDRKAIPFTVEEQLSFIYYCTAQNELYLAGFKLTFGASHQLQFGDLDAVQLTETGVSCRTVPVTEWIT